MSDNVENQSEQNAKEAKSATTESVPRKTSIQTMAAKSRDLLRKVHDSLSFGKKSSGAAISSPGVSIAASHLETSSKTELDSVAEAASDEGNSQPTEGSDDQADVSLTNASAVLEANHHEPAKRGTIQKTKMLGMKIYRDMKKGLGAKGKSKPEQDSSPDLAEASPIDKDELPLEAGDLCKDNVGERTEKSDFAEEGNKLPMEAETASELKSTAAEDKGGLQESTKSRISLHKNDLQTTEKSEQITKPLLGSEIIDSDKSTEVKLGRDLGTVRDATVILQTALLSSSVKVDENIQDIGAKESAEGTVVEPGRIERRPRERATQSAKRFIRGIVEDIGELSMDRATASEQSSPSDDTDESESSISMVKDILKDIF